jgi:PAS domain S-box-containing protein
VSIGIATPENPPPSIHTTTHASPSRGLAPDDARDWLYAFAMQTLDYALLVVDRDKRVLWANSGAAWLLAATIAEIVGSDITRFFTPGDIAFGIPEHEQVSALRQGSSDDDRWMLRADGSPFWASGKNVALRQRDGTPMGFLKIFRDQTESKMRIEALEKQALAADERTSGMQPAAGMPWLSLGEEIEAAIALAASRTDTAERSIQLLMPPGAPITLQADRAKLQEAIALLIENAVASTADDGKVWINGTTEGQQAVVRVEDNGCGIDVDGLASLFDLFTRPLAPPAQAGSEAGLALVRRIVEEHGGTIQAHSEGMDKGSVFTARLPVQQAPTAASGR